MADYFGRARYPPQARRCRMCAEIVVTRVPEERGATIRAPCPNCDRVAKLRPIAGSRPPDDQPTLSANDTGVMTGFRYGDGGRSTGSADRVSDPDDAAGRDQGDLDAWAADTDEDEQDVTDDETATTDH